MKYRLKYLVFTSIFFSQFLGTYAWAETLQDRLVASGVMSSAESASVEASRAEGRTYWNKGTRLEFDPQGLAVQVNVLLQNRYTFVDGDEDAGKKNASTFDIHRARFIVSGSALDKTVDFMLQTDFVAAKDAEGAKSPGLLDSYLNWKFGDRGSLKFGQWKTAISRQNVVCEQCLQLADRSRATNYFNHGRQIGIQGNVKSESVAASAAIFNGVSDGEGINRSGVDTRHTGVVALRADVLGKMNVLEEGDMDQTQVFSFNSGVAYSFSEGEKDFSGLTDTFVQQMLNIDANIKYRGFSTHAEFYWESFNPDNGIDAQPVGGYVQTGYYVRPQRLELAARYSILDCDNGNAPGVCEGKNRFEQTMLGINFYWWKQHLKTQLSYEFEHQDSISGADASSGRWMAQFSAYL